MKTNSKLEQNSNNQKILIRMIESVHRSTSLDDVYNTALDEVMQLNSVDMALIYLVDEGTNEAVLQAERNIPRFYLERTTRIAYPRGVTWKSIIAGEIINVEDIQKDPDIGPAGKKLGHHSALFVPVHLEDKVIGVLSFISYKERKFSDEEVGLLTSIGNQIAVAISRTYFQEKLLKQNTYKEIINVLSESIHRSLDLQDVMDNAVEVIEKNIPFIKNVLFYLVEDKYAVLKACTKNTYRNYIDIAGKIPFPRGATWKTINELQPRYVPDVSQDHIIGDAGKALGIMSYMSVPIEFRGKGIGCIHINSDKKNAFGSDELELLNLVSRQVLTAIVNARNAEILKESEERYRELFEANPNPMFIYDLETLGILEANHSFIEQYGYSRDRLLSMDLKDLHPEEDIPALLENVSSVTKGLDRAGTWRHILSDGSIIFVEITSHTLDYHGRRAEVVLAYNVTERKRAEDALRSSQNLLRLTLDSLTEAVFIVNIDDRRIAQCNSAACNIFGYSREELIGSPTLKLHVDEEHYREFGKDSEKILTEGSEFIAEFKMKRADGSIFPTEHEIHLLPDVSGFGNTVVSVVRDLSKYKKAEQEKERLQTQLWQIQRLESIGKLAGGIAHDFNNMLQAILGYVELSLDKLEPEDPVYRNLKQVRNAAKRSASLTQQLLAFARRQSVSPLTLDLNRTISDLMDMMDRLLSERIELVWIPGSDLWNIKVDPSQIDQILANLCSNARDAIEDVGRVIVETSNVTVTEDHKTIYPYFIPGEYVVLSVSDNGCGMDSKTTEHIFEPFYTTKEPNRGTGLGLATVYGIVKQNNGFIHVYSEPGEGTTVKIYFPRETGDAQKIEELPEKNETGGSGETILIVEDEKAILEMGKIALEGLGYNVLTAATPSEAIEIANKNTNIIDLLLTDVIMPEMNGRILSEKIKELIPGIKCIFMSGYTSETISRTNDLPGDMHFIQKPFSVKSLSDKIRKALDS